MKLSCGIVGLPNVGKSSLFNCLTKSKAEAANYPFCTIEPNRSIVNVPDARLSVLTKLSDSDKTIPAIVEFIDIAGLVAGASAGEGLGNQFLSHIREVNAIVHVVRIFDDKNIVKEGAIDPVADLDIVQTELMLADLSTIEKQLDATNKLIKRTGDKKLIERQATLTRLKNGLESGKLARQVVGEDEEDKALLSWLSELHLLTMKPFLIVTNVDDKQIIALDSNNHYQAILDYANLHNALVVSVAVQIESEIANLNDEEKKEFLSAYNVTSSSLKRLIQNSYKLLNLITFFTTGKEETRAWTIEHGCLAPQAAGVIHTDFEANFIKVEVIAYDHFVALGSYHKVKDKGKMRLEGKNYLMADGDICLFRFNK